MNWLWPRHQRCEDRVVARIGRVIHWIAIAFAAFGLVVSFYGISQSGETDPIAYFVVPCVWIAVAMLGRGLRYIIAGE